MSETTQILTATLENFASVVETSRRVPVLIDFWAPWCAPCRALTPVLERIARDYADRLVLAKVNVDEEPAVAQRFQVRSIPTLVLAFEGRELARAAGARSAAQLADWTRAALAQARV